MSVTTTALADRRQRPQRRFRDILQALALRQENLALKRRVAELEGQLDRLHGLALGAH